MSCYDLWYARNRIFANNGYCFTSAKAINIFGRRCYTSHIRLSRAEKEEVNTIKYWERRNGCTGDYVAPHRSYRGDARVVGIAYDDFLAVRSGPGTRYRQIDSLHRGDSVSIVRCSGRWCYIEYGNNGEGWVYSKYIR